MDKNSYDLIQAIHASPLQVVYAAAGAGTQALADLLSVGGASRTVLEAVIPYSTNAFDEFLGQPPEHYVTAETARLLAGRAYTRARWLADEFNPLAGIACTASIASDRPKRGEHRAYIASWTPTRVTTYALNLTKGARTRSEEEALISTLLIKALAETASLNSADLPIMLLPTDHLEMETYDFMVRGEKLAARELDYFAIEAHGQVRTTDAHPQGILSGSFNPLHEGHLEMANAARYLLESPVAFELSALNVDKPPIPPPVILDRIAQFAGRYAIYVSNAPTYVEKARLYPGATFVIGYDTAVRLFVARYYNGEMGMWAALDEIQARGSSFLVAGRVGDNGHFHALNDIDVPTRYRTLFKELPEALFRRDISSSALRSAQVKGAR